MNKRKQMSRIERLLVISLICLIGLQGALFSAEAKPLRKDIIQDAFVPCDPSRSRLEGYIGQRMAINLEQRLLKLNVDDILKPFRERPGVQQWVGEHAGKFLQESLRDDV